jgi:hypothetical protein
MDCKAEKNVSRCSCTYLSCSRRGVCCECVAYHRQNGEVPGCFFSKAGEATYDRSVSAYIRDRGGRA